MDYWWQKVADSKAIVFLHFLAYRLILPAIDAWLMRLLFFSVSKGCSLCHFSDMGPSLSESEFHIMTSVSSGKRKSVMIKGFLSGNRQIHSNFTKYCLLPCHVVFGS